MAQEHSRPLSSLNVATTIALALGAILVLSGAMGVLGSAFFDRPADLAFPLIGVLTGAGLFILAGALLRDFKLPTEFALVSASFPLLLVGLGQVLHMILREPSALLTWHSLAPIAVLFCGILFIRLGRKMARRRVYGRR